ncbi:MAG: hypothetical protein EG826_18120 [Deltaproteobacteria bacterium]|nr:hypothetical protein [Deltaproteobacteria bacterium]
MISGRRFQESKRRIIWVIVLFYVLVPMFDSMVCADCIGRAPFQGDLTHSSMKALNADASISLHGAFPSGGEGSQDDQFICSICANSLMGAEFCSLEAPVLTTSRGAVISLTPISKFHPSIHKPPQNSLA